MKWLFLAQKTTQSFVNSQQFHLHGGSNFSSRCRYYHLSDSMGWLKSACRFLNGTKNGNNTKKVDLEIISRETIKPTTLTPRHLRNFNLSILDQLVYDLYTQMILFIPNSGKASVTDVMSKRSKHLKETLSHILSQFYPLAGEVKDSLHIECNDKGVYYIEARVDQTLEEYLLHPDDEKVRELMPESPRCTDSAIGNYILSMQINFFSCGGIGLSTSMTHKIMDFHTYMIFMKAWAAAIRGSPETVLPSFVASEIFPNDPSLEIILPSELTSSKLLSTKRFVFDPTALAVLKTQHVNSTLPPTRGPTRMEATSAVIWKAAAKAASTVRQFSLESPHAFLSAVNIRKRASPPLPDKSIGNAIILASAMCFPETQPDLPILMSKLRESVTNQSDLIEALKGDKRHEIMKEMLNGLNILMNVTKPGDVLIATSVLNGGIYELDFGWGKPIWFYVLSSGNTSLVVLTDTKKGGGVEATVTLSPDEMEIFESDHELLSFATTNSSPLHFHDH